MEELEPSPIHYAQVAGKILNRVAKYSDVDWVSHWVSHEQTKDGQPGRWVRYGRNHELRVWIPRVYALLQMTQEKEV